MVYTQSMSLATPTPIQAAAPALPAANVEITLRLIENKVAQLERHALFNEMLTTLLHAPEYDGLPARKKLAMVEKLLAEHHQALGPLEAGAKLLGDIALHA
jgi:hypothetical protein